MKKMNYRLLNASVNEPAHHPRNESLHDFLIEIRARSLSNTMPGSKDCRASSISKVESRIQRQ
jgi:hypothetical protein